MCAGHQDAGEERQPADPPPPRPLPTPSSRTPKRSYILLTFRAPRRPQPEDLPLPADAQVPGSEPASTIKPASTIEPVSASESPAGHELPTAGEPSSAGEAMLSSEAVPPREALSARDRGSSSESLPESEPLTASERPAGGDPPHRLAEGQTSENVGATAYEARLLDASLIVAGAALFLCSLATLSLTWAWSWHAGAGRTFNLSHMHGICTSAMGELAQGASANVASHCLWVDGTWTEAVALAGGSCILAVIGIVRIVRALRTPT